MNTTQSISREQAETALTERGYTFNAETAEWVKGDVRARLGNNPAQTSWFLRLPGLQGFLAVAGEAPFGHAYPQA